jgi:hypothetical protein
MPKNYCSSLFILGKSEFQNTLLEKTWLTITCQPGCAHFILQKLSMNMKMSIRVHSADPDLTITAGRT